jgi:hypothetical protein
VNVLILRPDEKAALIDEIEGLIVVWRECCYDEALAKERIRILSNLLKRLKETP